MRVEERVSRARMVVRYSDSDTARQKQVSVTKIERVKPYQHVTQAGKALYSLITLDTLIGQSQGFIYGYISWKQADNAPNSSN